MKKYYYILAASLSLLLLIELLTSTSPEIKVIKKPKETSYEIFY